MSQQFIFTTSTTAIDTTLLSNDISMEQSGCSKHSSSSLDLGALFCDVDLDDCQSICSQSQYDAPRVSFGRVEIREYPITVDDHFSFIDNCPLTLEWDPLRTISSSVDERERRHRSRQSLRRLSLEERRMRISETLETFDEF